MKPQGLCPCLSVPWPGIPIFPPDLPKEAGSAASEQPQEPRGPRKPSRQDSQIQDSIQTASSITPLRKLFPIAQLWGSVTLGPAGRSREAWKGAGASLTGTGSAEFKQRSPQYPLHTPSVNAAPLSLLL